MPPVPRRERRWRSSVDFEPFCGAESAGAARRTGSVGAIFNKSWRARGMDWRRVWVTSTARVSVLNPAAARRVWKSWRSGFFDIIWRAIAMKWGESKFRSSLKFGPARSDRVKGHDMSK